MKVLAEGKYVSRDADYVMVHKDYLARLLYALKRIADDDGTENCYQNVAKSALGKHNATIDTGVEHE